jgi:hypothetical protein
MIFIVHLDERYLVGTIWEEPYRAFRAYMISEGRKGLEPDDVGAVIAEALEVGRARDMRCWKASS